jgi:hypothetical protein
VAKAGVARARPARRGRARPWLALLILLGSTLAALVAPSLADGYTALAWTRHHAAATADGPGVEAERLRQLGRWAARTVDALAPLPQAREAAAQALTQAAAHEAEAPVAAGLLYAQVAAALERQAASPWRRFGSAALATQARERAAALRARTSPAAGATQP